MNSEADLTEQDLISLIERGESETVEFKQSFDRKCIETAVAFANTKGGTILVGVSDDGAVRGVTVGRETLAEWVNQIAQTTEPALHVSARSARIRGKDVVVISVPESRVKPVSFRGRYFKRVANCTKLMGFEDIVHSVMESVGTTWDELTEPRASLKDLDREKVSGFIDLCNKSGRRPIPRGEPPMRIIEKLGLVKGKTPTRAAVLLFGKNPQAFYVPAIVKIARMRPGGIVVDDVEIGGSLFEQIDGAMQYFRERLQTKYEFTGEPRRRVIWEYPLGALREAVVNAVCHRDYSSSMHTQIRIYDDRIIVSNAGGLPPPLTPEAIRRDHDSVPRNRKIAEALFYAGVIEKLGRGTLGIIEECREAGLPDPEFVDEGGKVMRVIFRKDVYTEEYLRGLGLNERQIRAVMYVKEKGRITNREYQEINQVSNKTAYLELSNIVEKGIFSVEGGGRQTKYVLKVTKR